jgi:predicted RNA-binding protein associated with RNAse of E/G family
MDKKLTVIKCRPNGEEMWRWFGVELARSSNTVFLEAQFDMDEHFVGGLHLRKGDRLLERYYSDRWYNIFEVYDGQSANFKGWYCNLSKPAEFGEHELLFRDLALDLIVYPDGRQEELDLDEFEALEISEALRQKALTGWDELRQLFTELYKK